MKIFYYALLFIAIIFSANDVSAQKPWFWLESNDNYSKYFNPESVFVSKKAVNSEGKIIPLEIEAQIKIAYSYSGAAETIKTYSLARILPDPKKLSYSIALIKIKPLNRTLQYISEDFYDANNQLILSQGDRPEKEINSRSFDEEFYCAIVDEIFHMGERDRKHSPTSERWLELFNYTNRDGTNITLSADTMTMRLRGVNLTLWEWQTLKDARGRTMEIRFMKKAVNLQHGSELIKEGGKIWTPQKAWQDLKDDYGGAYRMISSDSPEYKGLIRLRTYVKDNASWVTRYNPD